jgi:threonylcarbamoyladenosine tRNA methylthiotransferase CDKAL1
MEKIFVRTFGCSLNRSDSEVMKGILKKAGFEMAEKREDADLVIINTCGVKGPTEANFFKYLEETKELKKLIIIAGCLPKMIPEKLAGNSMIGPHQLTKIVEVVEETLKRESAFQR